MSTDYNICRESETTESTSTSCICGPEYYCQFFCPEGDTVSTLISWQHFPRSTSSRSRCDDSEEIPKVWSDSTVETPPAKEEVLEPSKHSTEYPITKSFSQLDALHYLEIRHVFEFFNFLICHLVCNEPEDPVEFLHQLLNKCLKYRDSFGEPPLLFTRAHIKSLYDAFDPFERGYLTESQYTEALKSLGLGNGVAPHDKESLFGEDGCIDEKTFVFQTEKQLGKNLDQMLRIPKIWEENRRLYQKKMEKRKQKLTKREITPETIYDELKKASSRSLSKQNNGVEKSRQSCCQPNLQHEPEQLFLK